MKAFNENSLTEMVGVIHHPEASKAFDCDLFYTLQPMWFNIADPLDKVYIYVPRGFLTDGASIPKIFKPWFPSWAEYTQAAVFHDYLCEYLTIYVNDVATKISRSECDEYFNMIMKHLNINTVKRKLIHSAVVLNSHVMSIIYPSATVTKRDYEDKIRVELDALDQKKK